VERVSLALIRKSVDAAFAEEGDAPAEQEQKRAGMALALWAACRQDEEAERVEEEFLRLPPEDRFRIAARELRRVERDEVARERTAQEAVQLGLFSQTPQLDGTSALR
jgi:hypothetical protein